MSIPVAICFCLALICFAAAISLFIYEYVIKAMQGRKGIKRKPILILFLLYLLFFLTYLMLS